MKKLCPGMLLTFYSINSLHFLLFKNGYYWQHLAFTDKVKMYQYGMLDDISTTECIQE